MLDSSNPNDRTHISRLRAAIDCSRRKLRPFRDERMETLRQFVGRHYGENGSYDKVPVNLIELAMNIYMSHLVSAAPTAMVNTWVQPLKAQAEDFEIALNKTIHDIRLADTLRMIVFDALIAFGVCKTGIAEAEPKNIGGFWHAAGQPFADHVQCEDWFHDMTARRFEQIGFCGNRYKLPYEVVMECPFYDPRVKDKLHPTDDAAGKLDMDGEERSESLSQGDGGAFDDEYEDQIELEDVWLPRQNIITTLAVDESIEEPLRTVDWEGPDQGPYRMLCFTPIPGNVMPLPPAAMWRDMHEIVNIVWNKLIRQAQRAKSIMGARGPSEADAKRIMESPDGAVIKMDDPGGAKEFNFNAIDPRLLAFATECRGLFSWANGNLEVLGGLAPQTQTVGQEHLLAQASSKRVQSMQATTTIFTEGVLHDVGHYLWTDPLIDLPLTKRRPGVEIPFRFQAGDLTGDFYDYNIEVEAGSMVRMSPAERLQALTGLVQTLILPLMPLLQAQGIQLDARALMKRIAKLGRLPEIEEILIFSTGDPGARQALGGDDGPRKAPVSTRNYVRTGRPGMTRAGADAMNIQKLLSMPTADMAGASIKSAGQ